MNYKNVSHNPAYDNEADLESLKGKQYKQLLKDHIAKYRSQYERVSLNLAKSAESSLPTDKRLEAFAGGTDMDMVSLMMQYGRYLLISSSQPGGQPANLQGIWNDNLYAPWDSKYTININAEMNYWPALIGNLAETQEPLFSMIRDLSHTGHETASLMYGCDGWVAHHNTDLWRIAGIVDATPWGMFPTGGAWLSTHLWQHYLYTGDKRSIVANYEILKNIIPINDIYGIIKTNEDEIYEFSKFKIPFKLFVVLIAFFVSSMAYSFAETSPISFSISSNSTTLYGRRRTASVSWPPSS